MQEFPANSRTAKAPDQPREKLKPVTSAETVPRKRGLGRQFKEVFIGGSAKSAGQHMLVDIVIPEVRDLIFNAVQGGIERYFYGDSRTIRRPSGPIGSYPGMGNVNYQAQYQNPQQQTQQRAVPRQSRARGNFVDIIIANRREAVDVLDIMHDIMSRHGMVNVAELYELTGIESHHTDVKWGWTQLRGSSVKPIKGGAGGYLLALPDPEPLG